MASVEGAIRMKNLGKTLLLCGFVSILFGVIIQLLLRPPRELFIVPIMVTYLGIVPVIIGVTLWTSGWIVEGFFDPRGSR